MTHPILAAFQLLPRGLRWRWYALLPLVMMTAAVEATCAAAIFALLRVLTEPAAADRLATTWPAALTPAGGGHRALILSVTVSILALYLFRLFAFSAVALLKERVASGSVVVLSDGLLAAYLRGPFREVSRRPSSELVFRVQRATELTVNLGFASVIHLAGEVFVVLGLVVLLAFTAPAATLFAVLATGVLLLLPAAATRSVFERYGEQEQAFGQRLMQHLREGLGALREIRVYGREAFFGDRVLALRRSLTGVQRRHSLLSDVMRLGVETVFVVVLLILILIVTLRGGGSSVVSILGLYGYAGFRLVPSANRITLNLANVRRAAASARDVRADAALGLPRAQRDETQVRFERDIVFEAVSFRYQDNGPLVLKDIDLRILRGEAIGIVGSSGAGKSTLADLLLGLLEPSAGRILVDGVDLGAARASWQRHIGYVAQSSYFLDDTLRRNIAFGLDPADIDETRIEESVRAARLETLVRSLPRGVDSPVGEGGARLSGGERQRVAIARALYGRPAVLIFDEATSAVDPGTERELVDALSALRGTRTLVAIAHRASTVRDSDRIVMLKDGRIHAVGAFDELMAGSEDFRALMAADESPAPGNG